MSNVRPRNNVRRGWVSFSYSGQCSSPRRSPLKKKTQGNLNGGWKCRISFHAAQPWMKSAGLKNQSAETFPKQMGANSLYTDTEEERWSHNPDNEGSLIEKRIEFTRTGGTRYKTFLCCQMQSTKIPWQKERTS